MRCRAQLCLAPQYVILNDWGDAGIVLLDMAAKNEDGEYPIYWVGSHNLARLAEGEPWDNDVDVYAGYPEWVMARLEAEAEE